jgi:hypothetical protein
MSRFFRQFQHLVPFSEAWRTTLEKQLRQFFEGLAEGTQKPTVEFVDDAYLQVFPATTDQLDEWETQFFGQPRDGLLEADRRTLLDARWKAQGGQSPRYIQDILQAAGFDLYVHEWWIGDLTAYTDSTKSFFLETGGGTAQQGLYMREDGARFFTAAGTQDEVQAWDLTTPFDITTATAGAQFSVAAQESNVQGVDFAPDGLSFFIVGSNAFVYQYAMTTAWDVSTASYTGKSFDVSTEQTVPLDLRFNFDGSKMYVCGSAGGDVYEYDLSTRFDVSTATYNSVSLDTSAQDGAPSGMSFADSGYSLWIAGDANDKLFKYVLPAQFDIANAVFDSEIDVSSFASNPVAIAFGQCADKNLYFIDRNLGNVYQYWRGQAKDPRTYTNQPLFGTTQCGDDGTAADTPIAECGEQPPDQTSVLSATCNAFLVNDVGYLVNENLTDIAPPPVPDDPDKWPYFLYIGGQTFPATATISETLRNEFEDLILRIAPAQQWIVTLIDYEDPGGGAFGYTFTFDVPA